MIDISIILPVRNEEKALQQCIDSIKNVLKNTSYTYEIIVSDSSTDNSPKIAKKNNTVLVKHDKKGYGIAYLKGIQKAKGRYLFMADADMTYDFSLIPTFIAGLKKGNMFIIGNRFGKQMEKKAMPFLHKYIGNPALSFMFNIFFGSKIRDVHCGMRAIRKADFDALKLRTTGMEFASEMIVKAVKKKYSFKQIPITYKKRIGKSKLNTWQDGWRHLRFMLLYSPEWLFIIPGILLSCIAGILFILNSMGNLSLFGIQLQYHPLFVWSGIIILGFQMILSGFFAKTYTFTQFDEYSVFMTRFFRIFTLEKGVLLGSILFIISVLLILPEIIRWIFSGFPSLERIQAFIMAWTIGIIGIQILFGSFMISLLGIKKN